jgi:phosphate/sulfate permease
MKINRTKIIMAVILAAFILFSGSALMADTVTLAVGAGYPATQTYQVPSNTVAQITYAYLWTSAQHITTIMLSLPQATNTLSVGVGLIIAGPATITLNSGILNTALSICTIQTSPASALTFTPSSSVVIPNDGAGPVTIVLESSTDLINWTAANPGTYGTSSTNRFFRVRALR